MTQREPSWFKYLVIETDIEGNPVWKGFKKDTPKEEIKKYKAYVKEVKQSIEDGIE